MRYVEARLDEYNRDKAYRIYITKSLQLAPQSKYITSNYEDILKPRKNDTRDSVEIIADIMERAGLSFGE